jgi:hypothetical protein
MYSLLDRLARTPLGAARAWRTTLPRSAGSQEPHAVAFEDNVLDILMENLERL